MCSKVTSEVWSYKGFFGGVDQRSWKEGDCSLLSSLFLSIHTHPTLMSNYMSENQHRPYYLMSPVNFLGVQCISTWLGSPHPSCLGHQPSLQNVQLGLPFCAFLSPLLIPKEVVLSLTGHSLHSVDIPFGILRGPSDKTRATICQWDIGFYRTVNIPSPQGRSSSSFSTWTGGLCCGVLDI